MVEGTGMEQKRRSLTTPISAIGIIVVAAILVFGTIWMIRSAQQDTAAAVRAMSTLYLDELAGRREQVVEDNLNEHVDTIGIALDLISDEDLSDLEHMRAYQRNMKQLFNLERFAFVDEDGLVYTADEGVQHDIDQYSFDYLNFTEPDISVKNLEGTDRKVVIAMPIRDRDLSIEGKKLVACFMEQDMDVMLSGISMTSQESDATFCNIYTSNGIALTDSILGGLAVEDNLLDALSHADFEEGFSYDQVVIDFKEGNKGVASFTYGDIQETLSYAPVTGTGWQLTYLVRESVITDQIGSITSGTIWRSLVQSILIALVLAILFVLIVVQLRRNARLTLEKETSEAENRARTQGMEERLALQEQLLAQKEEKEEQSRMITALSSNYRSVYYLELDKDRGVCYQSRADLDGFEVGEEFNYLEAVTDYCNKHVVESYREGFLQFIQPDSIREALANSLVVSHRYMVDIDGREFYEEVRFAGVRHPEDRDDHVVHSVGAAFVDVDDETRASMMQQQALSEALVAAEQASKAKTVFLSNMSHEIRTPMNAIIGLNSIALNEPDLPEKTQEYLEKIDVSAQHLLGIINDILDMSRIESGKMTIKNEEFSFAKNLEQVNTIISGQCRDKGLDYECNTVGVIDDYYIGDGMKLKQFMINILSNAVKFTPEGGSVSLLIEEGPRYEGKATLKFTFKDTGIGMSEDFLPHLFDPFSQEDASSTAKYGSTGLGMPITKNIVELMNGHIEVESTKGVGTTFTATVTLDESERTSSDGLPDEIDPHDLSVLAIDDDPVALEHAQIVLGQIGAECDVAVTGAEGLEMVKMRHARGNDYDLLLVDWKMPEMDGVETTRQIRSIVGHDMPIIILTSYNWDEIADEARNAGVDTFVPKPLFAGSIVDEFLEAFKKKNSGASIKQRANLEGRHILLAEDMPVNAEIMVMVLGMRGVEVDLAENGRIAVEKFTGQPAGTYDAILMDMRMPEMDGLEATKAIRASGAEDAETIPVIALTANAFDEDVQRSMQAGLNAHLSKPVEPDVLFDVLETLIKP